MAKPIISARQRENSVALIHDLCKTKKYRKETMFFAIGLLDRYLSRWLKHDSTEGIDLVLLSTVSVLMGAKLNQPIHPSFDNMIMLLDKPYAEDKKCKKKLVDLEFQVVKFL